MADVYDALSSRRVYKDAFPHEKCVEIISREAGRQFDLRQRSQDDPLVVGPPEAFFNVVWIVFAVGVGVMLDVRRNPLTRRHLNTERRAHRENVFDGPRILHGVVRPRAVIERGDAEATQEVTYDVVGDLGRIGAIEVQVRQAGECQRVHDAEEDDGWELDDQIALCQSFGRCCALQM